MAMILVKFITLLKVCIKFEKSTGQDGQIYLNDLDSDLEPA